MKKVAFWTIAVAAGLLVAGLAFPRLGSHVQTAATRVSHWFDKSVSPEWEIDRLKGELARVDGDIRGSFSKMADQAVEVERMQKEVKDQHARLDEQKKAILTMSEDVKKGAKTIVYGGKEYPAERVRDKLSLAFESYQVGEKGVESKEKLLNQKETALAAAQQRLEEMRATKQQLELEVARLETDLQAVRMDQAKANTKASFDDTRLGQTKEDVAKLGDRIASMKKELEIQARYDGPKDIDVIQKAKGRDVVKEVDEYFGNNGDKVATEK